MKACFFDILTKHIHLQIIGAYNLVNAVEHLTSQRGSIQAFYVQGWNIVPIKLRTNHFFN